MMEFAAKVWAPGANTGTRPLALLAKEWDNL